MLDVDSKLLLTVPHNIPITQNSEMKNAETVSRISSSIYSVDQLKIAYTKKNPIYLLQPQVYNMQYPQQFRIPIPNNMPSNQFSQENLEQN